MHIRSVVMEAMQAMSSNIVNASYECLPYLHARLLGAESALIFPQAVRAARSL
jgi:hypothetical protein